MAFTVANRKKLKAALQATSSLKFTPEQVEEAAMLLIDGKKTKAEIAEKFGVTVQTLTARLKRLADPPEEVESAN